PQGETPECPRQPKNDRRRYRQVGHEHEGLFERLNQQPRWNVGDNDYRNDPPKNEPEDLGKDDVRIAGNIEEVEIAVDQSLGAYDPEADRGQTEHDGIMDRYPENERGKVKQN